VGTAYDALRESLRERGWVEGRNLVLEVRGAEGQLDRLPAIAAELVRPDVDLIVAVGPQPNQAAKAATSRTPIVMIAVADPVLVGLVQSLARPDGNITGLSTLVPGGFIAKQLELLLPRERLPSLAAQAKLPAMYLVPDLVRAGGLMSYGPDWLHMFRRAGDYADRILRGAKPADLPVEQPTKFELVLNLKTARSLGLSIPQSVMIRADEVIR
jgi:ABC-type uncharacterized transport system substrate-binding protein